MMIVENVKVVVGGCWSPVTATSYGLVPRRRSVERKNLGTNTFSSTLCEVRHRGKTRDLSVLWLSSTIPGYPSIPLSHSKRIEEKRERGGLLYLRN